MNRNGDGVFNADDEAGSITPASFWGVKADSLTIDANLFSGGFSDGNRIVLYGMTELRPGDIATG